MWLLSELSNIDKHRIVHLAAIYPQVNTFDPGSSQTYPIVTVRNVQPKTFSTTGVSASEKGDTVIARIGVERVKDPNVRMKLEIAPSVAFADGIAINEDIIGLLERIELHIMLTAIDPLRGFL